MNKTITLYHGSNKIIDKPVFNGGRKNNDFGLGFYCTENEELAKEWAVSNLHDGFSNRYIFDIKTPIARRARQYLIDNFGLNVNAYDVIIGYRADDSCFDYAESFINNAITVEQLSCAMKLGKLGEQIVIKSENAFSRLKFDGYSVASKEKYYTLRLSRNNKANNAYFDILNENSDGLYIQDIIRGNITNEDPRIPRNIY